MNNRNQLQKRRTRMIEYAFLLPAVIFLCAFIIYPIVYNFILSVHDIGLSFFKTRNYVFVGLENYIKMFTSPDRLLLNAMGNTLSFTIISIVFQVLISFSLALFFHRPSRLSQFSRGVIVIAYILPQTVTGLVFKFIYMKDGGIINHLIMNLGLIDKPIGWLLQPNTAMAAIIASNLWIGIPFSMLLFTSGLTTVDPGYLEAAMIDGAGWWRRLFSIVIPSISETIKIVLTLGFINTFKVFDMPVILTGGGPGASTEMLSMFSYKLSFTLNRYDDSAVVSNVLFVILLIVGLFYIRAVRSEGEV